MTSPLLFTPPLRRENILELGRTTRIRFRGLSIDAVAEQEQIIVIRSDGPAIGDGYSYRGYEYRPIAFESIAVPESYMNVWGIRMREFVKAMVLNVNSNRPEEEIFWHEFYHLHFSPKGIQDGSVIQSRFSTVGGLHYQEERRANDFAAAVLIPSIDAFSNAMEIAEHYCVSEKLAAHAVRFYRELQATLQATL